MLKKLILIINLSEIGEFLEHGFRGPVVLSAWQESGLDLHLEFGVSGRVVLPLLGQFALQAERQISSLGDRAQRSHRGERLEAEFRGESGAREDCRVPSVSQVIVVVN
jgi:hypothetical protein